MSVSPSWLLSLKAIRKRALYHQSSTRPPNTQIWKQEYKLLKWMSLKWTQLARGKKKELLYVASLVSDIIEIFVDLQTSLNTQPKFMKILNGGTSFKENRCGHWWALSYKMATGAFLGNSLWACLLLTFLSIWLPPPLLGELWSLFK